MRFTPTQKHGTALNTACISLIVIGSFLYLMPTLLASVGKAVTPMWFTGFGVICFITFMFLLIRYRMTSFEYVIRVRDDCSAYDAETVLTGECSSASLDFVVYKSVGARPGAMECVLSVDDLFDVIPLRIDGKDGASKSSVRKQYASHKFSYYDYTVTFRPKNDFIELIFEDGDGYVGIIIEDGNVIADYFKKIAPQK